MFSVSELLPFTSGRSGIRLAMLLLVVGLAGCGTGEYQRLVEARIQELHFGPSLDAIEWQTLMTPEGYTFHWFEATDMNVEYRENTMIQRVQKSASGVAFEALLMDSGNTQLKSLADRQVKNLEQQGYSLNRREEGKQGNLPFVELWFQKQGDNTQTALRIYQLEGGKMLTLSTTGDDLSAPAIKDFLGSVRR